MAGWWVGGWVGGWLGGWAGARAGARWSVCVWGRAAGSAAGWLGGRWYEGGAIKVHGSWRPRQVRAVDSRLRRHTRSCDNLYRARVSTLAGRGAPTPPSTRQFDGVVDPQTRDGTRAASLELAEESQRSGMMTRCAHATTRPPTARAHKRTRYRERAASLTYRVTRALVELAKIAPTRAQTNRRAYHHAAPSAYARARRKRALVLPMTQHIARSHTLHTQLLRGRCGIQHIKKNKQQKKR